ncbi:MAG: EAL domain-containing protein, partial [Acetobacteraceae bacterium]|nr:EAL domain-containing protein [Acetobacteraceae bacterium]
MSNCPAGACSNPSAATERQLWNGGGATCNESVRLDGELRAALARNELQVYFQPQFRADTLVINGFEALLRWPHPHHGTIPPATFIPIAEQSGFIVDLGMWVLERACEHAAPLHPRPRLAVNLSP